MPLDQERRVSPYDFSRLEKKVDAIGTTLVTLVRVEERQINDAKRLSDLETEVAVNRTRIEQAEKITAQWVNRGIGMWILAGLVWGGLKLYFSKGAF